MPQIIPIKDLKNAEIHISQRKGIEKQLCYRWIIL